MSSAVQGLATPCFMIKYCTKVAVSTSRAILYQGPTMPQEKLVSLFSQQLILLYKVLDLKPGNTVHRKHTPGKVCPVLCKGVKLVLADLVFTNIKAPVIFGIFTHRKSTPKGYRDRGFLVAPGDVTKANPFPGIRAAPFADADRAKGHCFSVRHRQNKVISQWLGIIQVSQGVSRPRKQPHGYYEHSNKG